MTQPNPGRKGSAGGLLATLRRIDTRWAKGEAALAAAVLLALIVVAATQALLRNLTLWDIQWANDVLEELSWSDSFMQKATLWLAFLGASLAVHGKKHIGIDIVARIAPARVGAIVGGIIWLGAALTCFFLAGVFFQSILNNAADLPFDYQAMTERGESIHRCDAPAELLEDSGLPKPGLFCTLRAVLSAFGAPISTPDTALQLIVPVMLLVMTVRFLAYGLVAWLRGHGVMGLDEARVATERERISVEVPQAEVPGEAELPDDEGSSAPASSPTTESSDRSTSEGPDTDETDHDSSPGTSPEDDGKER